MIRQLKFFWLASLPFLVACTTTTNLAGVPEQRPSSKAPPENRARIHTELAALYYQQGSLKTALSETDTALSVDPKYGPAYGMRAVIYMQLGENEPAADNFRQAVSLAPDDPEIRNNFGLFLCTTGKTSAGLNELEIAWKNPLYDTPGRALANASRCAANSGDEVLAAAYRKRAEQMGQPVDLAAPARPLLPKTP